MCVPCECNWRLLLRQWQPSFLPSANPLELPAPLEISGKMNECMCAAIVQPSHATFELSYDR